MRSNADLIKSLQRINPKYVKHVLEVGIAAERLNLEANKLLNNKVQCLLIRHRIADAELMALALTGDLPAS